MPRCQRGDTGSNPVLGVNIFMVQEWTAYDSRNNTLKFVHANNQKEAIKKAVNKHNIIPQNVNDVRPRTGDSELMTTEEFEEFMDAGLV